MGCFTAWAAGNIGMHSREASRVRSGRGVTGGMVILGRCGARDGGALVQDCGESGMWGVGCGMWESE